LLIGLTSRNAAGKDEVARYLVERRGFVYFSLSDILRRELEKRGLELTRENLTATGNELRGTRGPGVLGEMALSALEKIDNAVVVSLRNPAEIEALGKRPDFLLVAVDAPVEVRWQRVKKRARPDDAASWEQFIRQEQAELSDDPVKQQLDACFRLADRVIVNDGTLEDLHRKIEELPR